MFDGGRFREATQGRTDDELLTMVARKDQYVPEAIEIMLKELAGRDVSHQHIAETVQTVQERDRLTEIREEAEAREGSTRSAVSFCMRQGGVIGAIGAITFIWVLGIFAGKDKDWQPGLIGKAVLILVMLLLVGCIGAGIAQMKELDLF